MQRRCLLLGVFCAVWLPCAALAQPNQAVAPEGASTSSAGSATATAAALPTLPQPPKAPEEQPSPTLNVDVALSSVYVFRGLNMFQKSSQWDQNAFVAPSLTWNVPGTGGLTLNYWGAYQIVGSNIKDKLDAGTGAENDLTASWGHKLSDKLTAGPGLTAYVYPAASKDVAGTSVPLYLEPFVFASFATAADLGLKVTYMHGVQEAVSAYRYVYFNPTVGKTVQLSKRLSLNPTASFGYKLFTDRSTVVSEANTIDVLLGVALPVALTDAVYVKPNAGWAWTNLPGVSTGKEMVAFGGVSFGANY